VDWMLEGERGLRLVDWREYWMNWGGREGKLPIQSSVAQY